MLKENFFRLARHSDGPSRVGGGAPGAVLGMAEFRAGSRFLLLLSGSEFPEGICRSCLMKNSFLTA